MNLGAQLGPMSITKLSPNWACQMGPIHCHKFSGHCHCFFKVHVQPIPLTLLIQCCFFQSLGVLFYQVYIICKREVVNLVPLIFTPPSLSLILSSILSSTSMKEFGDIGSLWVEPCASRAALPPPTICGRRRRRLLWIGAADNLSARRRYHCCCVVIFGNFR